MHEPPLRPLPERLTLAELSGEASRHAPNPPDHERAVAELVRLATDGGTLRVDLLAEECGILLGSYSLNHVTRWRNRIAADLLWRAGANRDPLMVLHWCRIGRWRRRPVIPPVITFRPG